MKKITTLLIFIFVLVGCSGKSKDLSQQKEKLYTIFCSEESEVTALEYGKFLLKNSALSIDAVEEEYRHICVINEIYQTSETVGIKGAFRAKMGGVYEKTDVIKAVEAVEDGLSILEIALHDSPQDITINLYYGVTLASLPELFNKRVEALTVLESLLENQEISVSEREVVTTTLKRIEI